MRRADIEAIFAEFGMDLGTKRTVEGQIVATSGQAYNGPIQAYGENLLRVRVVTLPPGMDPRDPRSREHAKLIDVLIDAEDVSSIMVEPKTAAVVAPDGSKVVLS